jgi:hypothetical protein
MRRRHVARRIGHVAALAVALSCLASSAARAQVTVVDALGNIPASAYNPKFSSNSYKDWGNEPYVTVNPVNPAQIVVSSFMFGSPGGNILYSTNGGTSWNPEFILPNVPTSVTGTGRVATVPNDQNYQYDSAGVLHGVSLASDGNIYSGSTNDPTNANGWTWTSRVNQTAVATPTANGTSDQPWIAVGNGKVFTGYDNFNSNFTQSEERVAQSTNNGQTFTPANDLPISAGGQLTVFTNPGTRIAMDSTGRVYGTFGYATGSPSTGVQANNYRLDQFSGGASWDYLNSTPNGGGLRVAPDGTLSHGIGSSFGGINESRGNQTAIATDAAGNHVYVIYGQQNATNTGIDNLFVAEFHRDGTGNLVERANPVQFSVAGQWAVLPSITVLADGTLAILYDSFNASNNTFLVHLTTSTDQGLTFTDQVIDSFLTPGSPNTTPFPDRTRMLGDYQYITSLGNTIYGAFAARGNVNAGGIDTTGNIDPFFFTEQVGVPEPSPAMLAGLGLAAASLLTYARRRARARAATAA